MKNNKQIEERMRLLQIPEALQPNVKTLLQEQREDMELNIGMLRQWLNEDRIMNCDKMITNEDIKHWLFWKK